MKNAKDNRRRHRCVISRREQIRLHAQLLQGSPVARGLLLEAYWERLVDHLRRKFFFKYPNLQNLFNLHDLPEEAALQALENYFNRPQTYDPSKKCLCKYLEMSAEGDFLNLMRKALREHKATAIVRQDDDDGPDVVDRVPDGNDNIEVLIEGGEPTEEKVREVLEEWGVELADDEFLLLFLRVLGVRDLETTARLLDIESLTVEEQKRYVKRTWDRLTKRIKRRLNKENRHEA